VNLDIGAWQIRTIADGDAPALVKYANNRNVSRSLKDRFPYPYTMTDAVAWIRHVRTQVVETNFVIVSPDEAIGGIGLELQGDVHRRSAEIGFWLGEPHWGKGIASRAVHAFTEYAFAHLGLVRIFAGVFETNPASARVLEKAGYSCEGPLRRSVTKDGMTLDQLLYAIVRE
jgi:RimJ/RimL family protein N-acetyltransferase